MSGREGSAPTALGPSRTTVMVEGMAALVGLVALIGAAASLVTWGLVQLVRMLAT